MNIVERLRRAEARARKQAERGDERHHQIDQVFEDVARVRDELVAAFTARLDQIETNTAAIAANLGQITELREALAAHEADKKGHQDK